MNFLRDIMSLSILDQISQLFPPKPAFTEANLPDLTGKVYIVTGSNTGIGKQLARILYSKNAKVYVAARSEVKARRAIDDIQQKTPSKGEIAYLHLDLADLPAVRDAAEHFLSLESRLDVLFNNAGVMTPDDPDVNRTEQGYDLQLGVNCIGTQYFTSLLAPLLVSTAESKKRPGTVRVVWVASSAACGLAPHGGVPLPLESNLAYAMPLSDASPAWNPTNLVKYGVSKAGNCLQASEFRRRYASSGIVSVALNPGNLESDLWRTQPALMKRVLYATLLHPTVCGAYTLLYAGLSPDLNKNDDPELWVVPFGRKATLRRDLAEAAKSEEEGGTDGARKFWDWTEEQIKAHT